MEEIGNVVCARDGAREVEMTNDDRVQAAFNRILLELGYTDQDGIVAEIKPTSASGHYWIRGEGSDGLGHVRQDNVLFSVGRIQGQEVRKHFYVDDNGNLRAFSFHSKVGRGDS